MEKEMLVVGKLKEGKFEKFMGFMQSEEGMAERKKKNDSWRCDTSNLMYIFNVKNF